MKKLITYYRSAREELSKVIHPTREQVISASISVVSVVVVVALFLALVDLILSASVSRILS
ncbi:preprotein translocase subunit SecE [Helicobacter sp. MIT 00-7814]|uniref:preprotein translocase subunit SecE n=1 Tax=unclassified Helicobacter TaxID=2593540 RepID=UPI000E1F3438|nr:MULTISPECIES: preprotein translocase subunit SecE [unclassified Helicobacter]RDU52468.1 preprotein translocase subunit SecE [Helicobacter sp. MIT 99-10781]RDU52777.1 preprotein translocase subunit SecE [Helicobacter sp. MIT 00-7814]